MAFAVENQVRIRHGFAAEREFHEEPGTIFLLPRRAYSIISLKINGNIKVGGGVDFTFSLPKKIELTQANKLQPSDFMEITFAVELSPDVMDEALGNADEDVKSILSQRFGAEKLAEWEISTPNFIRHSANTIAGYYAERAMLRKGHDFSPDAFMALDRAIAKEQDKLRKVDLGQLEVPGEDPDADDAIVGFGGGDPIFGDRDEISTKFDYHEFYILPGDERRLHHGHRHGHHHHGEDL